MVTKCSTMRGENNNWFRRNDRSLSVVTLGGSPALSLSHSSAFLFYIQTVDFEVHTACHADFSSFATVRFANKRDAHRSLLEDGDARWLVLAQWGVRLILSSFFDFIYCTLGLAFCNSSVLSAAISRREKKKREREIESTFVIPLAQHGPDAPIIHIVRLVCFHFLSRNCRIHFFF